MTGTSLVGLRLSESHLPGLGLDNADIDNDLGIDEGFTASGSVNLIGAHIGGDLLCSGGKFNNHRKTALNAQRADIDGSVFMRQGFAADGELRLMQAHIRGSLECDGGSLSNPGRHALVADQIDVDGSVFLRTGFAADGEVRLPAARIGGLLDCTFGSFRNSDGRGLNLHMASIRASSVWEEVKIGPDTGIDFSHASVGPLMDDERSWPVQGLLSLEGFTYTDMPNHIESPKAKKRIEWIQRDRRFSPQPYEQLATVYRQHGQDKDAKKVLIAKERARRKSGQLDWWQNPLHKLYGALSYGHKPQRAIWALVLIIAIGTVVFAGAGDADAMLATRSPDAVSSECTSEYTCFQPFIYSLDTTFPIINLDQRTYWLPDAATDEGSRVNAWMRAAILAGWALSTIFVGAVSGLIRRA